MYRSRYSRSNYRRAPAPRRRFGPRLRQPKEPQRWEVGHFFYGNIINITDNATPNATIVTSLAQIAGHFGDDGSAQGRSLNNSVRNLEVGGVVFRYEILCNRNISTVPTNQSETESRVNWRVLLVTDRLDNVNVPVSIPNWFNVTTPVIATSSTSVEDQDEQYPTRIHWQNYHGTTWSNRAGNGTAAVNSQTLHVDNRRGGANLRLRLRLSDGHGLFWHFAQVTNASDEEAVFVGQLILTGTIYYRFRF